MSKRRLRWGYAFSALLAVIGAGLFAMIRSPTISGLACCWCNSPISLLPLAWWVNKRLMETRPMPQHNAFAWFYLGAFSGGSDCMVLAGNAQKMPQTTLQWGILVFLGVVASGMATLCGTTARRRWTPERWAL
ncbi:membrane protein YigM [Escherichia coli]|uniref:Membrane protein YigM n=1 Tax=Escherichia coli TaxID=562 RepID=A0A2X1N589_ECOLX|nr:membrane protein YigM [Escherichia coli]